jgi:transcription-repair coupling factor (superfamily II helicase)
LEEEIEDRFGDLPGPARDLIAIAKIRIACRRLGVRRIDAGPEAIALTFAKVDVRAIQRAFDPDDTFRWSGERLIVARASALDQRITTVTELLDRLD